MLQLSLEPIRKIVLQAASLCRLYRRIGMLRLCFSDRRLDVSRAGRLAFTTIITLCAVLVHHVGAQEGAVIRLEPVELTLAPGETGEIAVMVEGVAQLAGAEIHLSYDPGPVEVVDEDPHEDGVQIAHGGFLAADFVALNKADNQAGSLDYAVARMPPHAPASGSGTLAIIRLRGVGSGRSKLSIRQVLLADPDGFPIPVRVESAASLVTVSSGRASIPRTLLPCGALILIAAAAIVRGLQKVSDRVSYRKNVSQARG